MANELQNKVFHDETKARMWLEGHLWPDGPVCSHCGTVNNATASHSRTGVDHLLRHSDFGRASGQTSPATRLNCMDLLLLSQSYNSP